MLHEFSLTKAFGKACPLSHCMIFLDIDVNTLEITLKMWSRKMQEILDILDKRANKLVTNRKEIQ